jgi:hypothetical protein
VGSSLGSRSRSATRSPVTATGGGQPISPPKGAKGQVGGAGTPKIDPVVNDVPVDPNTPFLKQKAGNVCVPATACTIGPFHGTLPVGITVTELEARMGVSVGLDPTQTKFGSTVQAIQFVEEATGLKGLPVSKDNPFSSNNPGTFALVDPTPEGAHMYFGLILPENGGMYIWDPLTGGSTRSISPELWTPNPKTKIYKFERK